MNKERLLQLAEVLESDRAESHFNMNLWLSENGRFARSEVCSLQHFNIEDCGAVACIGGWTVILFPEEAALFAKEHISNAAYEILGLGLVEGHDLCIPEGWYDDKDDFISPYEAKPKQAAKVVRHLAETGVVDWKKAFEDE